jgi:ATPase subunit of ABC transporter with duplicated ATPase domains
MLLHTLKTGQREQQYNRLANTLRNFSGLAMIVCHDQKIYKSHFQTWKLKRKMLSINGKKKVHYLWKNF